MAALTFTTISDESFTNIPELNTASGGDTVALPNDGKSLLLIFENNHVAPVTPSIAVASPTTRNVAGLGVVTIGPASLAVPAGETRMFSIPPSLFHKYKDGANDRVALTYSSHNAAFKLRAVAH